MNRTLVRKHFVITEEQEITLVNIAYQENISISHLVRDALDMYIKKRRFKKEE